MTDQPLIFLFIVWFQLRSDGFLTFFSELNARERENQTAGGKTKRRAGDLNIGWRTSGRREI